MIYKQFNFLCLYFLVWKKKKDQVVICYLVVLVFINVIAEKFFLNLIMMSSDLYQFMYDWNIFLISYTPISFYWSSADKTILQSKTTLNSFYSIFWLCKNFVRHFNTTRFLPFSILKHSLSYTSISLYPLLKQRLKANVIL